MADKKGGPASDNIMSPAEMKPLLMLSKREPVNAVIGMTKDHEGVILLSKRIKPKKLMAQLKTDARKSKIELDLTSLRFGKAEVDADKESGLVMFTVNTDAPGALRTKLLELVEARAVREGRDRCRREIRGGAARKPGRRSRPTCRRLRRRRPRLRGARRPRGRGRRSAGRPVGQPGRAGAAVGHPA